MNSTNAEPIVIERIYKAQVGELWALWTTKDGFESWWGPQGFRVVVHRLEAHQGGALHYDMIADTKEMVTAMAEMDRPGSHHTRGTYREFDPHDRLVLTHIIDFLPGVEPYDSTIEVDFYAEDNGHARMVVSLFPMHDAATSGMQAEGFTSQLTKLDERYDWKAPA